MHLSATLALRSDLVVRTHVTTYGEGHTVGSVWFAHNDDVSPDLSVIVASASQAVEIAAKFVALAQELDSAAALFKHGAGQIE